MDQFSDLLLLDDHPLLVDPQLATLIGLNESIFLQQLHYWLRGSKAHRYNGRMWVYNTYTEWKKQFPFWTEAGIRGIIRRLEGKETPRKADDPQYPTLIISTDEFNKMSMDRTKWYTIDYAALTAYRLSKSTDEAFPDNASNCYPITPLELLSDNASDQGLPGDFSQQTTKIKSLSIPPDHDVPNQDVLAPGLYRHNGSTFREATVDTTKFQDQLRRETKGKRTRARTARDLTGFEAWYQQYPLRQNRDAAEQAWSELTPEHRQEATAAIAEQVRWPMMTGDPQYIPRAATWLRSKRWEDEPPPLATNTVAPHQRMPLPEWAITLGGWEAVREMRVRYEAGMFLPERHRELVEQVDAYNAAQGVAWRE